MADNDADETPCATIMGHGGGKVIVRSGGSETLPTVGW